MGTADKNEQIDDDILQSRADVLRARDIIPPYEAGPGGESKREESGKQRASSTGPGEVSAQKEKGAAEDIKEGPLKSAGVEPDRSEIPRLDLAEEIMAEQRKITGIRRKGPGEGKGPGEVKLRAEAGFGSGGKVGPAQLEEERVVAEIVARDIEKLYRA